MHNVYIQFEGYSQFGMIVDLSADALNKCINNLNREASRAKKPDRANIISYWVTRASDDSPIIGGAPSGWSADQTRYQNG
jgi:hypothetical protein